MAQQDGVTGQPADGAAEPALGRREANKRATRDALQAAADRLFEDVGFEKATVRDIASAAGVTERTFFRYFESKEELIADQTLEWMPVVRAAIVGRPGEEAPLVALREALVQLIRWSEVLSTNRPTPRWLFAEGPPAARLKRSVHGLLMKFEDGLADAVRARLAQWQDSQSSTVDVNYRAEVLARVATAACRSAFIRDWELRDAGTSDRPPLPELVAEAFALITA